MTQWPWWSDWFLTEQWNMFTFDLLRLHRCMMDSDDEVRDRATFYMNVLQQKQKALNAAYIFNGEASHLYTEYRV